MANLERTEMLLVVLEEDYEWIAKEFENSFVHMAEICQLVVFLKEPEPL